RPDATAVQAQALQATQRGQGCQGLQRGGLDRAITDTGVGNVEQPQTLGARGVSQGMQQGHSLVIQNKARLQGTNPGKMWALGERCCVRDTTTLHSQGRNRGVADEGMAGQPLVERAVQPRGKASAEGNLFLSPLEHFTTPLGVMLVPEFTLPSSQVSQGIAF